MTGASSLAPAVTCVVADDHPGIVDSLSHLLGRAGGIDVVGQARNGTRALELVRELLPDVAVLDGEMPGHGGIDVACRLAGDGAGCRTIVYSEMVSARLAVEALGAGAHGFVSKRAPLGEVTRAVRTVAAGGTFVDSDLAMLLASAQPESAPALTHREREILSLLADGLRNDEVAEQLSISTLTVATHVRHAMVKLHAASRTEAVAIALREALIQ